MIKRYSLPALLAMLLLALSVASASANKLSMSSQSFRLTWASLEFEETAEEIARCAVTLEGSFHSATFAKVAGSLVGAITRASVGTCAAGGATVLTESLPWHLTYESFSGTLPNITRTELGIIGMAFLIRSPLGFRRCLYRFTSTSPGGLFLNLRSGTVESVATDPNRPHTLVVDLHELLPCNTTLKLKGTGGMTIAGTTTAITVHLI